MESKQREHTLQDRLKLAYPPAAICLTDTRPEGALAFQPGHWGCATALMTAAMKGKTAVFSKETCTCMGGRIGLGLAQEFPTGFEYFLSCGDAQGKCPIPRREPEGYKKSPEAVKAWIEALPRRKNKEKYVVFRPLSEMPVGETPRLVVLYANPDQLSALIVLANYAGPGYDNVIAPQGAGCQTLCLIPLHEAEQERPRAVIGMTDISARPVLGKDMLSFVVSYPMFCEMERHIPGSFLDREAWQRVAKRL